MYNKFRLISTTEPQILNYLRNLQHGPEVTVYISELYCLSHIFISSYNSVSSNSNIKSNICQSFCLRRSHYVSQHSSTDILFTKTIHNFVQGLISLQLLKLVCLIHSILITAAKCTKRCTRIKLKIQYIFCIFFKKHTYINVGKW